MNEVWLKFFEQAAVVRDDESAQLIFVGCVFDALGAVAQCVDVKTRVQFVEDCDLWLQDGELLGFVALLLATGEVHIHCAVDKFGVETDAGGFLVDGFVQVWQR